MSRLRAKCPDCRAYTAVAIDGGYECHACGRTFPAGLVRVPRAWGKGGDAMAASAALPVPYPEAAFVDEPSLVGQNRSLALALPERPLVLGGCCCAHIGAVEALAARHGRIALLWFDAHGDLNTPETSPSGNEWGMPLRMLIDSGAVSVEDVALVGARSLDPPEQEFISTSSMELGPQAVPEALRHTEGTYVALDLDVFDAAEVAAFMPEPGGLALADVESLLAGVREETRVLGAGFSGLLPDEDNLRPISRLAAALGF